MMLDGSLPSEYTQFCAQNRTLICKAQWGNNSAVVRTSLLNLK